MTVAASMRGPPGVKVFFTDLSSKGRHRPTGGATQRSPSLLPFLERFLPALADSPCFHSHSLWSGMPRCQLESFISKRVLPSQNRTESPPFPETLVLPRPRSHPNSAIGYQTELHCPKLPSAKIPPPGCCATARTLPRTPTTGAATPPTYEPPPPPHASSHSCPRGRPASAPSASNPYPDRAGSECSAPLAPAACAGRHRPPC